MGRSVTITVGRVPELALMANRRRNGSASWRDQADATRALRMQAAIDARPHDERFDVQVEVEYLVRWPRTRYSAKKKLPDVDGLPVACKAILDGLVDAGVIEDDNADVVVKITARQERTDGDGCVIVTITETEAA